MVQSVDVPSKDVTLPPRLRAAARRAGKAAARWLPDRTVDGIRAKAFALPSVEVVRVVTALQEADVRMWLLGGWGVDALAGRETRTHSDLDLAVDVADDAVERAIAVLERLGYRDREDSRETSQLMPFRLVLRQSNGWTIDLVPVRSGPRSAGSATARGEQLRSGDWGALSADGHLSVVGHIDATPVPCVSARGQLQLRQGYHRRRRDERDLSVLDRLILGGSDEA
jgi:lincosamide nucleotidyltransferase A/C/D/E